MTRLRHLMTSAAFYPITLVYLTSVLLALLVAEGLLERDVGLVILTFVAIVALLVATLREIRTVHNLVNSQRDELLSQIALLAEQMESAGLAVPDRVEGSVQEVKDKGVEL